MVESFSRKQTLLVSTSPSLRPAGRLKTPPLVASQRVATILPTSTDCYSQSSDTTSVKCLHKYASWAGRYPKIGLFTTDGDEIVGPSSPKPNPSRPPLLPISSDEPFVVSVANEREDEHKDEREEEHEADEREDDECEDDEREDDEREDAEDNDEYLPTHATTRPASAARAGSSRASTEHPAETRRRKRDESPDDDQSAKRQKSDTGDVTPWLSQVSVIRDKKGHVLRYQCPDHPDVALATKGDVDRHFQRKDHQQRSFHCVECGRAFTRVDGLKRHIRNPNTHKKGKQERNVLG